MFRIYTFAWSNLVAQSTQWLVVSACTIYKTNFGLLEKRYRYLKFSICFFSKRKKNMIEKLRLNYLSY
ncbi:hypothetical protein BpHYR1_003355 [Brachionus plicatilis]|uniref:Uncharacterized protein n=1 Tax=Brachionus plicatilis TaxID=10195 RepID=A0A3M7R1J2_BRAPC|nr:hypothetical protein BpHYR1_003355 [Brachionus plicatilis]